MGMIVDLTIIAIIGLSTFLAYQKGLVKLAIGLCAFVISIVVTFVLYQPIANLIINGTGIDEAIENAIYEKVNGAMEIDKGEEESQMNQMVEAAKSGILPEAARNLSINIVKGGVMVVLFLVVRVALIFITALAEAIAKLPIINQLNKTTGMIYGILRGILIVCVVLLILKIPGQMNPNNVLNTSIEQSLLGKVIYQNNLLNVFF